MKKQIFYTILTTCMASSVAFAESPNSGPLLLTSVQMDRITAGGGTAAADVIANAGAGVLALTATSATTLVAQTNDSGNLVLEGSTAAAGGIAQAVAVGQGATTSTSVQRAVTVDGTNTHTYTINIDSKGLTNQTTGGLTVLFGSYLTHL